MKHEWMRQDKVDILKYLPAFLAKDPRFKATNDADSLEHDAIRIDLQDVIDQLYVESATWGLKKWEELVGIASDESKDITERRVAILNKLQRPGSVTEAFLKELVNTYISNRSARVTSIPSDYAVEIGYDGGQVTDYNSMIRSIKTYIPAHLGILINDELDELARVAIVKNIFDTEELTEEIKLIPEGNAPGYVAVFAIRTIDIDIMPKEFDGMVNGGNNGYCIDGVFDSEVLTG